MILSISVFSVKNLTYHKSYSNLDTTQHIDLVNAMKSDGKKVLNGNHMIVYIYRCKDVTIVCSDDMKTPQRTIWSLLESIPTTKTSDLGRIIDESMKPENDQINRIKSKIEDVKSVMIENLDEILLRGDKLDVIVNNTEILSTDANLFAKTTKKLRNKKFWEYVMISFIFTCIFCTSIATVTFIIIWLGCGLTFQNCRPK